jgi:histidinol-phosphatase
VKQDLDFAKQLARQAGGIMLKHFQVGLAHETKGDGTPVTIADEAINRLVIDAVRSDYPEDAVLGEEASHACPGARRVWVCDPIDGTIPYTFGVPTNMFSLALVEDGVPVFGVLYDPYSERLYEATHGHGALMNGHKLGVSSNAALGDSFVSLPGAQFGLTDTAELVRAAISQGLRIFSVGSVTYACALVASGQLAACVFPAESVWDIAAVKVIVEEAGGRVTNLFGNQQRYDQPIRGALISNGLVHDELVQLARPYVRV